MCVYMDYVRMSFKENRLQTSLSISSFYTLPLLALLTGSTPHPKKVVFESLTKGDEHKLSIIVYTRHDSAYIAA